MTVEETLEALVRIESVSMRSNTEIIEYLEDRTNKLGFITERVNYFDSNGIEKFNLITLSHAGVDTVELALVGHTDTVPYAKDWASALQLTRQENRLVGRGSCDTKGFIAAALTAVDSLDFSSLQKPLALIFTADEEVGCYGAKKLVDAKPFTVRNAIVGEPTSLRPMRAGKGYCLAEIKITGKEGHSAYPSVGASAIQSAARLIGQIERISRGLENNRHEGFDPPFTTINVGLIQGGSAKNIIPGICSFTLEWRPVPGQNPELVLDRIRESSAAEEHSNPNIKVEIFPLRIDSGMETPASAPIVKFLEDLTGTPAGTIAFGTEAPQLIELGAHAVVLGPGDIQVAHRTGEYVPVEDLKNCVNILSSSIARFCC